MLHTSKVTTKPSMSGLDYHNLDSELWLCRWEPFSSSSSWHCPTTRWLWSRPARLSVRILRLVVQIQSHGQAQAFWSGVQALAAMHAPVNANSSAVWGMC